MNIDHTSDLYSGEKISRSSLRLHALGDVDELLSVLGIARASSCKQRIKDEIFEIQQSLQMVASELATTEGLLNLLPQRIDEPQLNLLTNKIEALKPFCPHLNDFVIPGETLPSAYLHHARTIARRCERRVTKLFESNDIKGTMMLQWFNRLAAYLFWMAIFEEVK